MKRAVTRRVNARLSAELARKLEIVQTRTRKSVTAIITESLERYLEEALASGRAYDSLVASGFIGCSEGPSGLSSNYKADHPESLGRKA